jgi:ParB family chromosome partitioning protein
MEEADGYRRLQEEFSYTQEKIGQVVGKSRSHIANTLRLLDLPETVRTLVDSGELSAGHARAVLTCPDPAAAARTVVERGLNVRQTEKLARAGADPTPKRRKASEPAAGKGVDLQALEREMSNRLGLRVSVDPTADGQAGSVTIRYQSLDQFDGLLQRLGLDGGRSGQ